MHALLSDPATAAGQRAEPTVIAVSGLLRELILALTAQRPGTARRLGPVTLDRPSSPPNSPCTCPSARQAQHCRDDAAERHGGSGLMIGRGPQQWLDGLESVTDAAQLAVCPAGPGTLA